MEKVECRSECHGGPVRIPRVGSFSAFHGSEREAK